MAKRSKNYKNAKEKIEQKEYQVEEALSILKEIKISTFDESVDLAIRLGVDPKYPDQMVRGTVVLPHGTGRTKKVLVIAAGEKQKANQRYRHSKNRMAYQQRQFLDKAHLQKHIA